MFIPVLAQIALESWLWLMAPAILQTLGVIATVYVYLKWYREKQQQDREDANNRHANDLKVNLQKSHDDRIVALKKDVFVRYLAIVADDSKGLRDVVSENLNEFDMAQQNAAAQAVRLVADIESITAVRKAIHQFSIAANTVTLARAVVMKQKKNLSDERAKGNDPVKIQQANDDFKRKTADYREECLRAHKVLEETVGEAVNAFRKELKLAPIDFIALEEMMPKDNLSEMYEERLKTEGMGVV